MSADRSGPIYVARGGRVAVMPAGCAQPQGVGRRPVDERIRGPIQGAGADRGWERNKGIGSCGGKAGCPGAPDTRDERPRKHRRSGRTRHRELSFVRNLKPALYLPRKRFFALVVCVMIDIHTIQEALY